MTQGAALTLPGIVEGRPEWSETNCPVDLGPVQSGKWTDASFKKNEALNVFSFSTEERKRRVTTGVGAELAAARRDSMHIGRVWLRKRDGRIAGEDARA